MMITVSGLTGCGKDTLGKLLAEKLGYKMVNPTFKDLAEAEGISLREFQKRAEKDPDIDRKFDDALKRMAKGDCVVTTWLGPWVLDAGVRIKLIAPAKVRAGRIAMREGMGEEQALAHLQEREERNRKRYLKLYGVDIFDDTLFDACLSSASFSPQELLALSLSIIEQKK